MGRVSGNMIDKMINKQKKQGLENLKKYCEGLNPALVAATDSVSGTEKSM